MNNIPLCRFDHRSTVDFLTTLLLFPDITGTQAKSDIWWYWTIARDWQKTIVSSLAAGHMDFESHVATQITKKKITFLFWPSQANVLLHLQSSLNQAHYDFRDCSSFLINRHKKHNTSLGTMSQGPQICSQMEGLSEGVSMMHEAHLRRCEDNGTYGGNYLLMYR